MKEDRRLPVLDALRGLMMVLMALDHARFFVGRAHPLEYWGRSLPAYQEPISFLTRLSAHLCAPGFFFLMGVSLVLFADARRRRGWTEGRIFLTLALRGLLLIGVQQLAVNPAWFLGTTGSTALLGSAGPAGGGGDVYVNMDVLYGLGATMIVLSLLHRAPRVVLGAISLGSLLATQLLTPPPAQVDVLHAPWVRLLLVPGQTGWLLVNYPLIPWLGVAGLGAVFGKALLKDRERAFRWAPAGGGLSLALFVGLRWCGQGDFHPPAGPGWIDFLNVTKYPPSLAFVSLTLGVNLLLLSLLRRVDRRLGPDHPLSVFGRAALFFYAVHLYLYAIGGFLFPGGGSLGMVYGVWLAGLVLLYPACRWYGRFKRGTAPTSVWRLL